MSNAVTYSEERLLSMLAEVEKEFAPHLVKAEKSFGLFKAEDESEKKDEPEAKEEPKKIESEKPEDKGVKDQAQQDTSKAPAEGEKPESKEARVGEDTKENAAPSEDPHGAAEDHGYDDEDMTHMHSMYSSMSKPELKAHHDVIRKCMDGMGLAKCEDGMAKAETLDGAKDAEGYRPNGGPKEGEAKSESKGPATSDTQAMTKSEKDVAIEEVTMLKSELEAVKAKSAEDKKNLEAALQKFLTKFVDSSAPAGKAITSLDIIAKTEGANKEKPLSKSEVDAKLLAKAKDPTLAKGDREAINSYYFSKNIETVRHLLG